MTRDSFVFYKDWANVIRDLPSEVRLDVYDAVMEYAISGKQSDLKPMAKVAFGFIKQTIDRDTEKYISISEKRKKAGGNGALKRWQTMTNDSKNSNCYVNDNDNVNDKKFNKKSFRDHLISLGASEQHVNDWFAVRDKKKAAYTKTALEKMLKECKKNDFKIADAVRICAERGWQGFKYEWVMNERGFNKPKKMREI